MPRITQRLVPMTFFLVLVFGLSLAWFPPSGLSQEEESVRRLEKSAQEFSTVAKKAGAAVVTVRVDK